MKLLVFDNYDSFTYNLVHMVEKILHQKVEVHRNDQIPLEAIKQYDKIILSPGPGIPSESGLLLPLIKEYAASKSVLGVCLGQQAIGEVFGGSLYNLPHVYHGIATNCKIIKRSGNLFDGIPDGFEIGRYHSWVVAPENFPADLEITAVDDNDMIMALRHKQYDVQGGAVSSGKRVNPTGGNDHTELAEAVKSQ